MAHWLGRKYQMSIPRVMREYRRGNTYGTSTTTLKMPNEYKAQWHRPRALPNPYTAQAMPIKREELDSLEENWQGGEYRTGQGDLKEVVYVRDKGVCGMCGKPVTWVEAILDHKIPRERFEPRAQADNLENLQILHVEPCNRHKTKRDLQGGSRVR